MRRDVTPHRARLLWEGLYASIFYLRCAYLNSIARCSCLRGFTHHRADREHSETKKIKETKEKK